MMASSDRSVLGRVLVTLCVLALLGGDLFRGLHLLTTRHVVCVEHAELVHAAEGPDGDASRPDSRAQVLPGAPSRHHHDHCTVAATRSRVSHAIACAPASDLPGGRSPAMLPR